ncbi:hypothetical protein E2C01_057977 [Portunus trituberculatus]|uniref:Uncharacterized protein n=1 Tax=Portunus trituberculatus TaxID=210409 RepID=A0A5B7H428_PORTR|nr:hypothetical protein [Portunus trituberculatus]
MLPARQHLADSVADIKFHSPFLFLIDFSRVRVLRAGHEEVQVPGAPVDSPVLTCALTVSLAVPRALIGGLWRLITRKDSMIEGSESTTTLFTYIIATLLFSPPLSLSLSFPLPPVPFPPPPPPSPPPASIAH